MKQIWRHKVFPLSAAALLLHPILLHQTASASGQKKPSAPLLPPHTLMGATRSLIVSPDHLYAAKLTGGDAEPSFLSIYRVSGRHRQLMRPRIVDADSFVWVPQHPHLLAVAAGHATDDFEAAQLSLWNGGKRLRELVSVKDRALDGFSVEGVTTDGKVLVYDHFTNGKILINLRLTLPPSQTHIRMMPFDGLKDNSMKTYVVKAHKGQTLAVRLKSPDKRVFFYVMNPDWDINRDSDLLYWYRPIKKSGEYDIRVVSDKYGDHMNRTCTYTLQIKLSSR